MKLAINLTICHPGWAECQRGERKWCHGSWCELREMAEEPMGPCLAAIESNAMHVRAAKIAYCASNLHPMRCVREDHAAED